MRLRHIRLALLCATFLCPASDARAEPISTAIGLTALIAGGLGVSAATAGIIGGVLISGAVSVGATLISRSLQSTPDSVSPSTPIGVQGQMSAGAVIARNRVYGKMAIDGKLEYWRVHQENNAQLQLVISLASGPHEFFGIMFNGRPATLEVLGPNFYGINELKWAANGVHTAYVRFYNGFYDQEADADLIAASDPANPWTVNDRGRGVCYAVVNMIYIPDVYPNGIPSYQFIIGARVYDRRKDSTSGGTGAHRLDDQHTWEFSDNVAVTLNEFERGLTIGSQPVLGRHLAPVDMINDYFIGSANICDEAVSLKGGGTEARYRIGMNVGADRDLVSVERDFCTAMAGEIIESIGAFGPIAGVAQVAAMTFTDDDLVDKREVRYSQRKSRSELVNSVFGAFSDPTQNYQPTPYAPRFSETDAAQDGGPFVVQRDVIMIPSETQAQRVVEHLRREARLQATATVTLKHKFSPLESGDWVRWISARRNFDKTFKIIQHSLNDDRTITLALKEISATVFAWTPATDQLDPLNPVSLPGYGIPITSVPDFALFQLQIGGAGGVIIPALHCVWSPIFDRTVDAVIVEYRVGTDDATIKRAPPFDPQNGEGIVTDGIQAATPYQARAIITTTPPRTVVWTDWAPITSPAFHIVPESLRSHTTDFVDVAALAAEVRGFFRFTYDRFAEQEDFIGELVARQNALNYDDKLKHSQTLSLRAESLEGGIATVHEEFTAFAGPDGVYALHRTELFAALGEDFAVVTQTSAAVAGIGDRLEAFWGVVVDANGHAASFALASDGTLSQIAFKADVFTFSLPGFPDIGLTIGARNGTPTWAWGGDALLDGILTVRHVQTNLLIADFANIDTAKIRTLHLVGASITVADGASSGLVAGNAPAYVDVVTVVLTFNDTINGTRIPIVFGGQMFFRSATNTVMAHQVVINGAQAHYDFFTPPAPGFYGPYYYAGAGHVMGTGGTVVATIKLQVLTTPTDAMAGSIEIDGSKR